MAAVAAMMEFALFSHNFPLTIWNFFLFVVPLEAKIEK
jgi:hypothetical protein